MHRIHSTDGVIVLTAAQKSMREFFLLLNSELTKGNNKRDAAAFRTEYHGRSGSLNS